MHNESISDTDIAIIGMSCRFPGAKTVEEFWRNLRDGVESILPVSQDQIRATLLNALGYIPEDTLAQWLNDPNYIGAAASLEDIDLFDAAFFGYNSTEAELLDPQQRIFLECAWEALEDAGYASEAYRGLVGVYAGAEVNSYNHVHATSIIPSERDLLSQLGNESGYLTTRVSYKLNIEGPSFNIQSACSTSLVAIHVACQSLKSGECEMALAGGVVAYATQKVGYFYREGAMFSRDGHCRPFDALADGTVFANGGVGVVVLKLLTDALTDGDNIYAVIKGTATNNDGSIKTGYTAPSIGGQVKVVSEALAVADVSPESISYIEAHGTATPLGDPIEVAALSQAFSRETQKRNFCALGSVKSNVGHLGAAAGVAGVIKTALALKHKMIPPSLNYEQPNPQINFAHSPFYVNNKLFEWTTPALPRRAGVSSFGMGGTNAHVILEEAPQAKPSDASKPWQLLTLSAKTGSALEVMTDNLIAHLKHYSDLSLPDLAFTLHVGRKAFPHRRMLVCRTIAEAIKQLEAKQAFTAQGILEDLLIVFMFSGQGSQYINMGLELYHTEAVFRKHIDKCAELLKPHLKFDLREVIYPSANQSESARQQLNQTFITQPALFVIEYAMARLWMEWGVYPRAMIGHSIGEYVAACLAGVFSLEDALALVATRGRLMQELPSGAMLTISLPEKDIATFLSPHLSLAASNSTTDCVVSGPMDAIEQLEQQLTAQNIIWRRLHTSHAFHSQMMEPILGRFTAELQKIHLNPPTIPYISNITGTWITEQEATDPHYWAAHLRQPVRFAAGLQVLFQEAGKAMLEVGPGRVLTTLARRHPDKPANQIILPSLRHPQDQEADSTFLLNTAGRLWCAGVSINWSALHTNERHQRISLPTYPFERKRYWKFPERQSMHSATSILSDKKLDLAGWFSIPSWKRSMLPITNVPADPSKRRPCWLIFIDNIGLGQRVIERLERNGEAVITVIAGERMQKVRNQAYMLRPQQRDDYSILFKELSRLGLLPTHLVHLWTVVPIDQLQSDLVTLETTQALSFYSLLYLTQALGEQNIQHRLRITVLSNNLQEVVGGEARFTARAIALGPVKVIPYEYSDITCRSIDVVIPGPESAQEKLADQIVTELKAESADLVVAYRGSHRWIQTIEPVHIDVAAEDKIRLRQHGVYLITGGLGGIGLTFAEYLASTIKAKLVLLGRAGLPARETWEQWLATHDEQDETSNKILRVRLLEQLGAEVLVISADVIHLEQIQAVISEIDKRFGALNGVIHAAGMAGGGTIQLKATEAAESVLAPKVKGTLVLEAALKDIQLDFLILCSSLYSILGGPGQVDYCAGNAFLDNFAFYNTSRNGIPTISIDWDAWQEVGMAINAVATRDTQASPHTSQGNSVSIDHPLLENFVVEPTGEIIYTAKLSVTKHWVLDEHRILGTPVVSGTTFLEMVRAAFKVYTGHESMEIQDVVFFTPLRVEANETKEIRLSLKKEGDDFSFLITSNAAQINDGGVPWVSYVQGKVGSLHQQKLPHRDIISLKERLNIMPVDKDPIEDHKEFMQFGPRWTVLKEAGFNENEGLAALELAKNFWADLEKFHLHPGMLDVATSFTARHQAASNNVAYLPLSYKRLSILRPLPAECLSYARAKVKGPIGNQIQEVLIYDVVITDRQGIVLVEIEDYTLRRVRNTAMLSFSPTLKEATTSGENQVTISNGYQRRGKEKRTNFQYGIRPEEGVEVFKRILSWITVPQIIISVRDIQELLEQAKNGSGLSESDSGEQEQSISLQNRPDLQSPYVAPSTELEQQIAAIWQRALGIDRIGIHDNFFEIGGDSVLSIQIISRLREAFRIELSMDQLFGTPTIEGIAGVITQKQIELLGSEQATELLEQVSRMPEEEVLQRLGKNSIGEVGRR